MYWNGRPNREFFALSDVGCRVELLLQLGILEIVDSERLTNETPVLRYKALLSDAETAENTIQQVVRMYLPVTIPIRSKATRISDARMKSS